MKYLLTWLRCRLFHRDCSTKHRSSKWLLEEMKGEGRRVDVTTFDLKRQREDLARTIGGYRGE